jgi:hypothetical protein
MSSIPVGSAVKSLVSSACRTAMSTSNRLLLFLRHEPPTKTVTTIKYIKYNFSPLCFCWRTWSQRHPAGNYRIDTTLLDQVKAAEIIFGM